MQNKQDSGFRHDFRTYLNHILGYSDILKEDAYDSNLLDVSESFSNIHKTTLEIRKLVDAYFHENMEGGLSLEACKTIVEVPLCNVSIKLKQLSTMQEQRVNPQFLHEIDLMIKASENLRDLLDGTKTAKALDIKKNHDSEHTPDKFETIKSKYPGRILVVDDDPINRDLMTRFLERQGHTICSAISGEEALSMITKVPFDLIILDVMMPNMNGYQVLETIKNDPYLQDMPVIIISSIEDSYSMAHCIELGAEDYLPREFDPIILKARIDASLEKRRIKIQKEIAIRTIIKSQQRLKNELAEAADYVLSLLPEPLVTENFEAAWEFIPSLSLGGDIFSYYRLDDDNFGFFLIDVSGHGIEAALVSVSIMNMLKSQSLNDTDFKNPASVLTTLNNTFKMEEQNNMYFTIWYGVFEVSTRMLKFASGGSTPAVLVHPDGTHELLSSEGIIIGVEPEVIFETKSIIIKPNSFIYLFSDGVYEVKTGNGDLFGLREFASLAANNSFSGNNLKGILTKLISTVKAHTPCGNFDDDVSLLSFHFL